MLRPKLKKSRSSLGPKNPEPGNVALLSIFFAHGPWLSRNVEVFRDPRFVAAAGGNLRVAKERKRQWNGVFGIVGLPNEGGNLKIVEVEHC